MMLPLARFRDPGDALLLGPDGSISAGAFFTRVLQLAAALPAARFVINLSENRVGFMLGFAAALVRGQVSLLPSGQGRGDWQQLLLQYPGASIISDRPNDADAFDLSSYLLFDATRPSVTSIPSIAAEVTAAILFTSGSTGQPSAHAKSWGQLWRGAANLAAALGWSDTSAHAVVGSVAPQHMFGLETTVMLPWHLGLPVHSGKPLLAADLETILAQCARPCWWMTTPVHLRAPLTAAIAVSELAGIVASTMSLPPTLAAAAEAKWQVPVVEIYGSTESGAVATRRTASEQWWTPLREVELLQDGDGEAAQFRARGSHLAGSVLLGDQLRIAADGRFLWLGRSADMLKIGGKRASLAALNRWIAEIPGVDDAAYFVPDAANDAAAHDDAHPARRLVAFYVSATLSPLQVRSALATRVDAVFVPRPLYRLPRLPRDANGKLSHAALSALFVAQRCAVADDDDSEMPMVVAADHPALAGHFPGNLIVPGVVLLERVADDIQRQLPHIVLGTLRAMRFYQPLRPGQRFVVAAGRVGERVDFKVRQYPENGNAGAVIASGRWDCDSAIDVDQRA